MIVNQINDFSSYSWILSNWLLFIKIIIFYKIDNFVLIIWSIFIQFLILKSQSNFYLKLENNQTRTLPILSFDLTPVWTELGPAQPQLVLVYLKVASCNRIQTQSCFLLSQPNFNHNLTLTSITTQHNLIVGSGTEITKNNQ